jgi:hypothetical protein
LSPRGFDVLPGIGARDAELRQRNMAMVASTAQALNRGRESAIGIGTVFDIFDKI